MHVHDSRTGSVLKISVGLMLSLALLEVIAGILAHSLALISDAGHNFTDSAALLLSCYAFYLQSKPATQVKTYGYHRAGVLAAFVNAMILIPMAGVIFYEAYQRARHPSAVQAGWMEAVGAIAFLVNAGVSLAILRGGRAGSHDVNVRTVLIHTAADTASTAGIVVGGLLIQFTGMLEIDPLLGFAIGCLILWGGVGIIRETLNILLEGLPRGLKLETVIAALRGISGVEDLHDVHIWSLSSHTHALSAHVAIADIPPSESLEILRRINALLEQRFQINHTTIQFEYVACEPDPHCYAPAATLPKRVGNR